LSRRQREAKITANMGCLWALNGPWARLKLTSQLLQRFKEWLMVIMVWPTKIKIKGKT